MRLSTTATSAPNGCSAQRRSAMWDAIEDIDDGELWETHQALKAR